MSNYSNETWSENRQNELNKKLGGILTKHKNKLLVEERDGEISLEELK